MTYEYGKDFEMDELRTNHNISEILKGKKKRKLKQNLTKKFTAWITP